MYRPRMARFRCRRGVGAKAVSLVSTEVSSNGGASGRKDHPLLEMREAVARLWLSVDKI